MQPPFKRIGIMPDTPLESQHPRTGTQHWVDLHAELLAASRAARIAAELGGAKKSGKQWLCRCPAHPDKTPSLALRDADDGHVLYHCHAGCSQPDVRQALRSLGLLDADRIEQRRPGAMHDRPAVHQDRLQYLLGLLQQLECTVAASYLRTRGLDLPPLGHHLRYLPARPPRHPWPCMVGIVTDFKNASRILTLHFTRLRLDGLGKAPLPKEEQRRFLGGFPKKGGVIRLCDDADVTLRLGVAEGVETALGVYAGFRRSGWFQPVWSALDAVNLGELPHLRGIEELYIYGDRGPVGEGAADDLAQRWLDAGAEVFVSTAPVDDWNPAVAP
jgi:hypothetical protein